MAEERLTHFFNPFTHEQDAVLYLHFEGKTNAQISKELGIDREKVHKRILNYWKYGRRYKNYD